MRATVPALVLAALALSGCGTDDRGPVPSATPTSPAATSSAGAGPTGTTHAEPEPPPRRRVRLIGIDASHHQGAIDWRAVAGDGISFAYLKATEGTTFTDPTFLTNAAAARDRGIEVGGYHYFSLCTPGAAQADHLASVLDSGLDSGPDSGPEGAPRDGLPPAVDLELLGSCATPPPRDRLLTEIRAFLDRIQRLTGQEPVVYLFPDFEERYDVAAALAGYRHWVRDLDGRPRRAWWIWQRTDSGSVDGVDGPVDVNVMLRHGRRPLSR